MLPPDRAFRAPPTDAALSLTVTRCRVAAFLGTLLLGNFDGGGKVRPRALTASSAVASGGEAEGEVEAGVEESGSARRRGTLD